MSQLWKDPEFLDLVKKMKASGGGQSGDPGESGEKPARGASSAQANQGLDAADAAQAERAGAGKADSAADGACAPAATRTDLFFCKDSAELTDSDKKSLDDYANAFRNSSTVIAVNAYSSMEGDADHNLELSEKRAKAVEAYLYEKGVLVVNRKWHGATDQFSPSNLSLNRRVTLSPPPSTKHLPHRRSDGDEGKTPGNEDEKPKPTTGNTGKQPKLTLDQDDVDKIPHRDVVKRAVVKAEVEKWLRDLGKAQK